MPSTGPGIGNPTPRATISPTSWQIRMKVRPASIMISDAREAVIRLTPSPRATWELQIHRIWRIQQAWTPVLRPNAP